MKGPTQRSDDESIDATRMTLGEHIAELRTRLVRSVITIAVCFAVAWVFRIQLTTLVRRPHEQSTGWLHEYKVEYVLEKLEDDPELDPLDWFEPETWEVYGTSGDPDQLVFVPDEAIEDSVRTDAAGGVFFLWMKVCFYFALFFGGPVLLWQMWQFVAAGLYHKEKRVVHAYFPLSVGLFVAGVVFGFLVMVPNALYFLSKMNVEQPGFEYWQSADIYWHFLVSLTLALGAVFQLPVLMIALSRLGIVEPRMYSKYRGHMVVTSLVVAAVLTPPDPVTQMMMAIPIVVLYEIGHLVARVAYRKAQQQQPEEGV